MIVFSHLENVIANIVDLNNRWVALAEFRVQHAFESRRGCDQDELAIQKVVSQLALLLLQSILANLVSVKDAALNAKLDVT